MENGVWASPGSDVFSVMLESGRHLFVRASSGADRRQLTGEPGTEDSYPDWSPDGDRILFVSASEWEGNWDLYSVHVDGSNRERLTDHPAPDYAPAWSHDGSRIAFDSNRGGALSIYVMDADGANVTRITE